MKVNIREKLQVQWQASTRPNSQKAMAKTVPDSSTNVEIGEDYEGASRALQIL